MELIKKIRYWFNEWLYTFSLRNSILSSKKIERFIFVFVGVLLTIFFVIKNADKLTGTEFTIVVSPLFMYAGYNLSTTQKEKNGTETKEKMED